MLPIVRGSISVTMASPTIWVLLSLPAYPKGSPSVTETQDTIPPPSKGTHPLYTDGYPQPVYSISGLPFPIRFLQSELRMRLIS